MPNVPLDERGMPDGWPMHEAIELGPGVVKQLIDDADQDITLLDCRLPKEKDIAEIAGSTFIPMQELGDRLDELDDYLDRKLVVFCHAGMRSMKVAMFLRERGFEDVWSMAGGIDLWSQAIDETVPRY
ncbi:MAG: rhodanese-like domain-containing protein [Phycisphaeraceae bacterium]